MLHIQSCRDAPILPMHFLSFLRGNGVFFSSAVSDVEIAHVLNVTLSDKMTCRFTIGYDLGDARKRERILFEFENRSSDFAARTDIF